MVLCFRLAGDLQRGWSVSGFLIPTPHILPRFLWGGGGVHWRVEPQFICPRLLLVVPNSISVCPLLSILGDAGYLRPEARGYI